MDGTLLQIADRFIPFRALAIPSYNGACGFAVECFSRSICHSDFCFAGAPGMGSFSARDMRRGQGPDEVRICMDGARFRLFWIEARTAASFAQPARRAPGAVLD